MRSSPPAGRRWNNWRTLYYVVLPVLRPALAAVGVLVFINTWNEYLWPLPTAPGLSHSTIRLGLAVFSNTEGANPGPLLAAATVATLPALVGYLFAARRVTDAFMHSGIRWRRTARLGRVNRTPRPAAAVLVEGMSDRAALEALAARRGRDLAAERVCVVPMGGATNIAHFLDVFGPRGFDVRLAGLCDAAEERGFRRGLERAGLGTRLTRTDLERLGFFVCVADLEDELIRCLGVAAVEDVVAAEGELGSFRTLQKQPAQRARSHEGQLRRFMGTRSGRKIRYGRLLVEALDLRRVPRSLDRVLAHV